MDENMMTTHTHTRANGRRWDPIPTTKPTYLTLTPFSIHSIKYPERKTRGEKKKEKREEE